MAEKKLVSIEDSFSEIELYNQALDCYKFAKAHAGIEMDEGAEADFITTRNLKSGWLDLMKFAKQLEALAKDIKTNVKYAWNVGTSEYIPDKKEAGYTVSWSKQSYTYEFEEGQARVIAQSLIDSGLTTKEQLFDEVSVTAMCKAAGITMDKMLELFHEGIIIKPKERTLTIK